MRIGDVAAAASVNIQTVRFYERRGLLEKPKRTESGQRTFPGETVRLIRFIKRAQDLGFTLDEIKDLLRLRKGRPRGREIVRSLADSKLRGIQQKIRRLQAMEKALRILSESCQCASGDLECPILEALDDPADREPSQPKSIRAEKTKGEP